MRLQWPSAKVLMADQAIQAPESLLNQTAIPQTGNTRTVRLRSSQCTVPSALHVLNCTTCRLPHDANHATYSQGKAVIHMTRRPNPFIDVNRDAKEVLGPFWTPCKNKKSHVAKQRLFRSSWHILVQ